MTSDSQRTHLDSDLGSWDFTGGSQDPHRRGDSSRPGRPHPRGSSTSPRPCVHPSRQRELAMSSPSRQHIPHGSTLTSCPSPHCRVRALKGYCSEGPTVGRAAWPGPLGLEQDRAAPPGWETAPGKTQGGPLAPGQTRHTPASLPACPSHTTGVPGLSAVQEQLKLGWHRSACLCRHGWQHPRQGPVSFLSSLIRQDSRWSATREGAHGGARPSLRHCPHISAERRGAGEGQS